MTILLIAAVSENNAIGINNDLPWHLPDDFQFFKKTTLGHPILMGRKTLESLGKPLPGRTNLVISSAPVVVDGPNLVYFTSVDGALSWLEAKEAPMVYIIGGGQIFKQTMDIADELVITRVHTNITNADVFFPEIDHSHWHMVSATEHPADEKHQFAFTFQHFKRVEL